MSFSVVLVVCKILLVDCNGFLVLRLGFLAFAQRLVAKRKSKAGFSEIRVESNSFQKRQHCLGVLVVAVEFLPLFQLFAGASAFPGQIVGHCRRTRTIIRALLTTAPATNAKYQ